MEAELLFGKKAVLPVDIKMLTYLGVDWWKIKTTEDLIVARTEQLLRRDDMLELAHQRMMESRNKSVRYWDQRSARCLRDLLRKGDLVLLYNRSLESQWGKLFTNRWNGTYQVVSQFPGGIYQLAELDGTLLARRAAASHVKRFYARGSTLFDETEEGEPGAEDADLERSQCLKRHQQLKRRNGLC